MSGCFEQAVYSIISEHLPLYWDVADQDAERPFVIARTITGRVERTANQSNAYEVCLLQLDIYADDRPARNVKGQLIRNIFLGATGRHAAGDSTVRIMDIEQTNKRSDTEETAGRILFRQSFDFRILYQEE